MRKTLLLTGFLLSAGFAQAQVVSPVGGSTATPASPPPAAAAPSAPSAPARAARAHMTAQERFDKANTSHDGKLTKEQAHAAHMYSVARNFEKIDTAKHGYVTFDELKAYRAKTRAERRAARESHAQSHAQPAAVAPQSAPPSQ